MTRSVSKAEEPNSQFRPYMEDRYVSIDPFMAGESGSEQWAFFAVYDGHGGTQAADHCERELHRVLMEEMRTTMREHRSGSSSSLGDEAVAGALTRTFQRTDDQLKDMRVWQLGCTATVVLVRRSSHGLRLHSANVGDSRAIAVDDSRGTFRLSQDHRATDASEVRRIQQSGGFVQMGRVAGILAVSRALGDHAWKGAGVSWRPHISARDATNDVALVIASDGLWDTLDDADVRAVIEQSLKTQASEHVAHRLVGDAKHRGSMDNIACLVAFL